MIGDFLKSEAGIIIISIVWGLGLATLFKRSCQGPNCKVIEYRGPPVTNMKYAWKYDGDDKCYGWTPYLTKCEK
jgi:hypothetical protein